MRTSDKHKWLTRSFGVWRTTPEHEPETVLKCPKCGARAYEIWQIAGISYLKCGHCGHRSGNL